MNKSTGSIIRIGLTIAVLGLAAQSAHAQPLTGEDLISALQEGGYVLVMRHGPASLEAARGGGRGGGGFGFGGGGGGRGGRGGGQAPPEPTEEALEQESIQMLTGMRHAIWTFDIPIGAVYTSPARRTVQHAEELPFAEIMVVDELVGASAGSGWLADKLTEATMAGANTLIVTHSPNIRNDLGMSDISEGETLIVRPGDDPTVVGRMGLREWSELAIEFGN
jgi:hypothetical protein